MSEALTEITDCPYYLITRASLTITALLKRDFAAAGASSVRPAYLGALMCLWREDGQRGIDLGRCCGLEPSTMTGLLDRMERDGLVERRPDPSDRRAQRIHLTAEGGRAQRTVMKIVNQTLERVMAGVPERQAGQLKSALRRVLQNARTLEA